MFNIWQYYHLVLLPIDKHHTAIDSDGENNKEIIASNCICHDGKGTGHSVFKVVKHLPEKTRKPRESYSWRTSATLKLERATHKHYTEKLAVMSRRSVALKNNAAMFTTSNHNKCIV
jgi:hypothetical protein